MKNMKNLITPVYVVDEKKLTENLDILKAVQEKSGCKILLAQKAFSMFYEYPLMGKYLAGTTASGLFEAKLGAEEMGLENHVYAPAYKPEDLKQLFHLCDHIVFNSFSQLEKGINLFGKCIEEAEMEKTPSFGIRVNPEFSTQQEHAIYDPCAPGSRLGVTAAVFEKEIEENPDILNQIDGLHFHTLCEQNSDDLEKTFRAFENSFGKYLYQLKWLNMGGGHHITRADYDRERLVELVKEIRTKYDVEVYLEPGEAIALNAGYLVTEVLDIVDNGIKTLILDASAACHMPDVLEMPYRPPLRNSGQPGEKKYDYRLSSYTCLAGDIIGDYSFDSEIHAGDRLVFEDMAIYSMVKNNTFNGICLPDIAVMDASGECKVIKSFGYEDFKTRLS